MPLELTQSRVQKIWVPIDHRPSLPRCECSCARPGCGVCRVQGRAIVCGRFVLVPFCGLRAPERRAGGDWAAAGCASRAGLRGRCGPGNCKRAWPGPRRRWKACACGSWSCRPARPAPVPAPPSLPRVRASLGFASPSFTSLHCLFRHAVYWSLSITVQNFLVSIFCFSLLSPYFFSVYISVVSPCPLSIPTCHFSVYFVFLSHSVESRDIHARGDKGVTENQALTPDFSGECGLVTSLLAVFQTPAHTQTSPSSEFADNVFCSAHHSW